MKSTVFALAAAAALVLSTGAQAEFKDFTVNGQKITKAQQEEQAAQVLSSSNNPHAMMNPELETQVKDWITEVTVMSQYAKKHGMDKDAKVKQDMQAAVDFVLYNAAVADFMKKNPVTDKELRPIYDQEKARWGDKEYLVRHIMVKTEKEARDVMAEIKKGAKFEEVAAKKSIDDVSRDAGGLLDWQSPSVYTGDLAKVIRTLKKGETAKDPVKSAGGWHVVKVENVRPAEMFPTYEKRKTDLLHQQMQRKLQNFIHTQVISAEIK